MSIFETVQADSARLVAQGGIVRAHPMRRAAGQALVRERIASETSRARISSAVQTIGGPCLAGEAARVTARRSAGCLHRLRIARGSSLAAVRRHGFWTYRYATRL